MSRGVRPQVPLLLAVVALLLAGCGGDDGGDPSAFAARTDRACRDLGEAVATLRDGLVRSPAESEAAGLATVLRRYATSVRSTAEHLAAGRPPADERAFQRDAVRGLRRHAHAMTRAAQEVRRGRVARELRAELRGGALPAVPAPLRAQAPRCRRDAGD